MSYEDKLNTPEWDTKRKEVLARDDYQCQHCKDRGVELHVHHKYYLPDTEPWDYKGDCYITLCKDCHDEEHVKLTYLDNNICDSLRERFMADDIDNLMVGVNNIKSDHVPEITATMLRWLMSDREALDIAFRMYFMNMSAGKKGVDNV